MSKCHSKIFETFLPDRGIRASSSALFAAWLLCFCFTVDTGIALGVSSNEGKVLVDERDPIAEYLFAGWLAEREKIVTAHYVVEGGFQKDLYDPSVSGDFKIEAWLSQDAERYESNWSASKGFASSWIRLNDKIISWPYGGGKAASITIKEPKDRDWLMCARIDPRVAPLLGVIAFPDRLTGFRDLREGYVHGYTYRDLKEVSPGVFEFMLESRIDSSSSAEYRTKVRINEGNGFSIERMEQYERLRGRDLPGDLICWTDTEWQQIGSVWVPVRMAGECNERGTISRKAHAEFKWSSLNEPISPERFDPADFAVPNGKLIVDLRTPDGEALEVGRIDRTKPVSRDETNAEKRLEQRLQPDISAPVPPVSGSPVFSPRVVFILLVNIVLVGSLLFTWRRRKMSKSRAFGNNP